MNHMPYISLELYVQINELILQSCIWASVAEWLRSLTSLAFVVIVVVVVDGCLNLRRHHRYRSLLFWCAFAISKIDHNSRTFQFLLRIKENIIWKKTILGIRPHLNICKFKCGPRILLKY